MLEIQVMLEVPLKIAAGLASGQLERVGGVIVDATSKQVVSWLREGGQLASNPSPAGGLLDSLLNFNTGGLMNTLMGAVNIAATAQSHYRIMQQMVRLETLITISSGIGVLNLAATMFSHAVLTKRLNDLETKIELLYKSIAAEFEKDRQAKLKAATLAAKNAFGMEKRKNKVLQAHNAIDRFDEVRQFLLHDFEELFKKSRSLEQTVSALAHAMDMDSLLVRCHLELDELSSARNHLEGNSSFYEQCVNELVGKCLGYHRARFFHKSVKKADLYRVIAIEDWLHRNDKAWQSDKTDDVCMKVVNAYRKDFWNDKAIKDINPKNSKLPTLADRIAYAELLIEKFEGFRGFRAELEGIARLGITYSEWERQQEEALTQAGLDLEEYDDYALLVDKSWLDKQPAA